MVLEDPLEILEILKDESINKTFDASVYGTAFRRIDSVLHGMDRHQRKKVMMDAIYLFNGRLEDIHKNSVHFVSLSLSVASLFLIDIAHNDA